MSERDILDELREHEKQLGSVFPGCDGELLASRAADEILDLRRVLKMLDGQLEMLVERRECAAMELPPEADEIYGKDAQPDCLYVSVIYYDVLRVCAISLIKENAVLRDLNKKIEVESDQGRPVTPHRSGGGHWVGGK